ncbi:uncharacterized protein LOC134451465 [Engraulis encrasicolus]|uniref:uncharacterized protein LOC134451465 n=1 Tax=Engraulis encrasicolus TaxID=184585 RepID=UPI002FCF5112
MINKCLKGLFIGANVILAVCGLLFVASASFLHYIMQSHEVDVSVLWELFGLMGGGMMLTSGLYIYGATRDKTWPLTACITATLIGVVVFLMQGAQAIKLNPVVMKYVNHYVKSEEKRRAVVLGLNAGLSTMFGLAALEVVVTILAALIIHQQQKHQTAILDPATGGSKPPAYTKLCPIVPSIETAEDYTKLCPIAPSTIEDYTKLCPIAPPMETVED